MATRQRNRPWPAWTTVASSLAITAVITATALLAPPPAQAVHDDTAPILNSPFELDGDAIQDSALQDWDTVLAPITGGVPNPPAGSGAVFVNDGPNAPGGKETSAWDGSNKDIHAVESWKRKTAKVTPDKNNITNAYAKAFSVDHDDNPETPKHLFIYFGADRFANNGDAALGFWFFKENVALENGTFSGSHTDDDLLVQVDFVNGGSSSEIQIFRWKGAGNGSHGTLDELQFEAANGTIVCTDDDSACAITNDDPESSPWNYTPKAGVAGTFPQESFYEGAIDVTALIGEVCFSSFMAETRTSHSETAELADFALGDFNLCSIAVAKSCTSGPVIDESGTFLTSTLTVTVTNDGFGPVYDPAFEEDIAIPNADTGVIACRLVSPTVDNDLEQDELKEILAGELGAGDSATAVVECDHSTSKVFNNVTARAAASPDGSRDITADYQMKTTDTCELTVVPMIDVTKACKTVKLVQVDDTLQPQVCNTITLTNTSNEKLVNVTLVDTPSNADATTLLTGGELDPGESITPIEHCYTPTATDSGTDEPEEVTFSNEVMASADGAISGSEASDEDNVQCKLCPPPQSEPHED